MNCRRCSKPVRFVVTPGGKRMILDVDPDPMGNVVVVNGVARVLTTEQRERPRGEGDPPRWMPHQATCNHGAGTTTRR